MTCKWLIIMVSFRPLSRDSFPFQIGVSWLINGGDPNYLRTGMILQVDPMYTFAMHRQGSRLVEGSHLRS